MLYKNNNKMNMAELKTKIKNKTNRKKSRKNDDNTSMYLKTS